MSTPRTDPLSVLRGNPAPEELAALLVVLTAVRHAPDKPGPPSTAWRGWGPPSTAWLGWGPPTSWNRPEPATAPVGRRRTPTPNHGRKT